MKKFILLFIIPFISFSQNCDYTLQIYDSFGDGWKGNQLTIYVNGTSIGYAAVPDGESSATYTLSFSDGDVITGYWTEGLYSSEVSGAFYDSNGSLVQSFYFGSTVYFVVDCPYDVDCPYINGVNITTVDYNCYDWVWNYGYTIDEMVNTYDYDCTCVEEPAYGCTDPEAENYDPGADVEISTGSCDYGYSQCSYTFYLYDSYGDGWNGNELYVYINGEYDGWATMTEGSSENFNVTFADGDIITTSWVEGLYTGEVSVQIYNSDGTLIQSFVFGDNISFTVDCGGIDGCTDVNANNFNPNANVDDGSCEYVGCTDVNADNFNPNANVDDGSCVYTIYGCTDPEACNYESDATDDFLGMLCIYPEEYYDCNGDCVNDFDFDNICDELEIYGCTDSEADNFNWLATEDDGSCIYTIYGCTNGAACNYDPMATDDFSGTLCDYPGDNCELDSGGQGVFSQTCECVESTSFLTEEAHAKKIIQVIDILGKTANSKGFQLVIYDDGTVEKKYFMK